MTTVVTGATGHLGANLVPMLLDRGEAVRVLIHSDDDDSLAGLDVDRIRGDVRDIDSLRRAFAGAERVYHLAALISIVGEMGGRVRAINVDGARNTARACLEAGVERMVHCCSVHAFRQQPVTEPLDESRSRVPDVKGKANAYDRSKAAGEAAVREIVAEGLDAVIVHPTGVIGPVDYRPSRMGRVFLDLYHRRLPSLVAGGFDWVDVRDVCQGMIAAMERGRTGESYLLSGHYLSVAAIAELASRCTGVRPPRFVCPMWLARLGAPFMQAVARLRGSEPLYTREALEALRGSRRVISDKAGRELGFSARPALESVRDAYRWFAENGRISRNLLERENYRSLPAGTTDTSAR